MSSVAAALLLGLAAVAGAADDTAVRAENAAARAEAAADRAEAAAGRVENAVERLERAIDAWQQSRERSGGRGEPDAVPPSGR